MARQHMDSAAKIGSSIMSLNPTAEHIRPGGSKSAITSTVVFYALDEGASSYARWGLAMYLAAAGVSSHMKRSSAKTWLYSLVHLLYGPVIQTSAEKEATKVMISAAVQEVLHNLGSGALLPLMRDATSDQDRFYQLRLAPALALLPADGELAIDATTGDIEWVWFYGYFGIVCFSMIKDLQANMTVSLPRVPMKVASGFSALINARPLAVRSKYKIPEGSAEYIGGDMNPSPESYGSIFMAWRELPFLRRAIFTYMSFALRMETSAEDEAVLTSVRLMRWGENSHVALIVRFLAECEYAKYSPLIAAAVRSFQLEFEALRKECAPVLTADGTPMLNKDRTVIRDDQQVPWVKLIHLDMLVLCQRNQHELLLDVALLWLKRRDSTLNAYVSPGKHMTTAQAFADEYAAFVTAMEELDRAEGAAEESEEE